MPSTPAASTRAGSLSIACLALLPLTAPTIPRAAHATLAREAQGHRVEME